MIDLAEKFSADQRVRFHVNLQDDLSLLEDGMFDFAYSTMVLQHNPPELAERYIREFFRVLKRGGVAVFDMPAALSIEHVHFSRPVRTPAAWLRSTFRPPCGPMSLSRSR